MKKINEIFYSLQGEGYFTGTAAVFVRFSGCNIKCSFCDTDHEGGEMLSDEQIIAEIKKYPAKHIVLTGGEPSLFIDRSFIDKLHQSGLFVQIETNGTNELPDNIDWITCSPKHASVVLEKSNEVKVVYTGQDMRNYDQFNAEYYYLQPCSGKNTEDVVNFIMKNPQWKLSLQIHILLNIR